MRPRTAIQLLLWVALLFTVVAPTAAMADADNDIGGATMVGIGQSAEGQVDAAADPVDVWAIPLVAGEEVSITVIATGTSGKADARLLAPGLSSLAQAEAYSIVKMPVAGGTFFGWKFERAYTPARAATFYVWINSTGDPLPYRISVQRTVNPPVTGPDSDDVPGLRVGVGSVTGIVDSRTDKNDVYQVKLIAGRPVTFRMRSINNSGGNGGWLTLLDPDSTSVNGYKYWTTKYKGTSMSDNAYNFSSNSTADEIAELAFTPPVTAVYYLWVKPGTAFASNFPYMLTIEGAAAMPGPPTRPLLTAPTVPASTLGRYRTFSSSGLLGPKHALRPYGSLVTVYLEQRNSRGAYVTRKKFTARNADSGGYTKYAVSFIYPGAAGKWRLRAYHKDLEHVATWSSARYFTVSSR